MTDVDIFTLTDKELVIYAALIKNKSIKDLLNEIQDGYSYKQYVTAKRYINWSVRQSLRGILFANKKQLNYLVRTTKQVKLLGLAVIITVLLWVVL